MVRRERNEQNTGERREVLKREEEDRRIEEEEKARDERGSRRMLRKKVRSENNSPPFLLTFNQHLGPSSPAGTVLCRGQLLKVEPHRTSISSGTH